MADHLEVRLSELYGFDEDHDELNVKQLPWEWDRDTWWQDNMIFYHGTHVSNLDVIASEGLKAGPGSKGHGVYLALDPFTARGYASMSSAGGERTFKKQSRSSSTPMSERVVLVVKLPKSDVGKLKISQRDSRILDRESWEERGRGNPRYWELAEVVYPSDLPPNYIKGFMKKA